MKWISVEDKLPKPNGATSDYVLINDANYGMMIGYLCLIGGQIYWTLKEDREVNSDYILNVTHWQSLPKEPA